MENLTYTADVRITKRSEELERRRSGEEERVWVDFSISAPPGVVQSDDLWVRYSSIMVPLTHPLAHLPVGKLLRVTIEVV